MSQLPISEHFLSVGNRKPKLKWVFKPEIQAKIFSVELGPQCSLLADEALFLTITAKPTSWIWQPKCTLLVQTCRCVVLVIAATTSPRLMKLSLLEELNREFSLQTALATTTGWKMLRSSAWTLASFEIVVSNKSHIFRPILVIWGGFFSPEWVS